MVDLAGRQSAVVSDATTAGGQTTTVAIAGQAGLPTEGVEAVAVNVTVEPPAGGGGFLTINPVFAGWPTTSNLNFMGGEATSGSSIVEVGPDGTIDVIYVGPGPAQMQIEVLGWFGSTDGDSYVAAEPVRLVDTRTGTGPCSPAPCADVEPGSPVTVAAAGQGAIPADATAVVLNVVAVGATTSGSLDVSSSDSTAPPVSSVSFGGTQPIANLVTTAVGPDGAVVLESTESVDVIIDVVGWYAPTVAGDSGDESWSYAYDADGLRTSKTAPDGTVTRFVWDRSGGLPLLLAEVAGDDMTRYVYGPGLAPIADIQPGGEVRHHHHDQIGSTRALTDDSGAPVAMFTYDAYGAASAADGEATTPFGYVGEYHDADTGFVYLRARYYDPETGQFLTRDPLESSTGEPYGYAGGNPANLTDPSGLAIWDPFVDAGRAALDTVQSPLGPRTTNQARAAQTSARVEDLASAIAPDCAAGRNPNGSCRGAELEANAHVCPAFGCLEVGVSGRNGVRASPSIGAAMSVGVGVSAVVVDEGSECPDNEFTRMFGNVASIGGSWRWTGTSIGNGSGSFDTGRGLRFGGGVVHGWDFHFRPW